VRAEECKKCLDLFKPRKHYFFILYKLRTWTVILEGNIGVFVFEVFRRNQKMLFG